MMVYTKNLILVCTGRDTTKAASLGMPVLQLCLGISQSGALQRLKVSAVQRHCLLGVTDPPQAINFCSAERIAADLVFEARRTERRRIRGFEHDTPLNRRLLAAFDEALYDADIPLYVPLECGRTLSHAILTVSTAISGGSLTEYISSLQAFMALRGLPRFCSRFRRISPCRHPRRTAFHSVPQQEPRCSRRPAHSRSSRELCAKYFTYMNADGQAHFVLYDDDSTLAAKLAQLAGCGVQNVFALFPDAAGLLKPQT